MRVVTKSGKNVLYDILLFFSCSVWRGNHQIVRRYYKRKEEAVGQLEDHLHQGVANNLWAVAKSARAGKTGS